MDMVTLGRTGITVNKNGFGALPIWGVQREKELDEFLSYIDNTGWIRPPCWPATMRTISGCWPERSKFKSRIRKRQMLHRTCGICLLVSYRGQACTVTGSWKSFMESR